jgi:hypothetical protein
MDIFAPNLFAILVKRYTAAYLAILVKNKWRRSLPICAYRRRFANPEWRPVVLAGHAVAFLAAANEALGVGPIPGYAFARFPQLSCSPYVKRRIC